MLLFFTIDEKIIVKNNRREVVVFGFWNTNKNELFYIMCSSFWKEAN